MRGSVRYAQDDNEKQTTSKNKQQRKTDNDGKQTTTKNKDNNSYATLCELLRDALRDPAAEGVHADFAAEERLHKLAGGAGSAGFEDLAAVAHRGFAA